MSDLLYFKICLLYYRSVIIATKKSAVLPSTLTASLPTNAVSVVSSVDSSQASDVGGESPGEWVISEQKSF